tara:strand:- start:38 stop:475 length:438 start_codon:yes stop_codon:yes gene_type:complete
MQLESAPYFVYFIFLLFVIAKFCKRPVNKNNKKVNDELKTINLDKNINPFLIDAEKKLLALKELFFQQLISEKIYIEKTNIIADVVSKVIKNDIFEFAQRKNNEIVNDLKKEILNKFDKRNKSNIPEANIDDLLISIDKRLDKKQ